MVSFCKDHLADVTLALPVVGNRMPEGEGDRSGITVLNDAPRLSVSRSETEEQRRTCLARTRD